MIDGKLLGHLDGRGIPFCLMGATALAAHGFARFTADVDLLTLSPEILHPGFWEGLVCESIQIRRGEPEDPLGGVVRIRLGIAHDVVLGKGFAAEHAVETAVPMALFPCRVATPLALVLLKLEAGSPRDRLDILGLVSAQLQLTDASWIKDLPRWISRLSPEARAVWEKLRADLPSDRG